ncbi:MAG: hypothetical protein ACJAYB_000536 [Psychromonas sp.]
MFVLPHYDFVQKIAALRLDIFVAVLLKEKAAKTASTDRCLGIIEKKQKGQK